jgi:predicted metalloprotease with PDZ domain
VSQDEVSRLSEDIKDLTEAVHSFKENFAASNARHDEHIERLERSDSEQWKIIRDTQTKIMRYAFFSAGAVSVMAFFGILEKIRALLMG